MSEPDLPPSDEQVEREKAWERFNGLTHMDVGALLDHPAMMQHALNYGWDAHARFLAAVQPQDGEGVVEAMGNKPNTTTWEPTPQERARKAGKG